MGGGSCTVVVVDGGDLLSFARVGLSAPTMLDPGPFGCIGIGVPYGIAASLARPEAQVVVATGDGAFGFNAIEIDTAVRHGASVVVVVANNSAWQIEVHDLPTLNVLGEFDPDYLYGDGRLQLGGLPDE